METNVIDSVTLGGSVDSINLSVWGLFWSAHWIVKAVIIILVIASIWSWAIIFEKVVRMRWLTRKAGRFEDAFWSGGSLDELYDQVGQRPNDPMSAVFSAARWSAWNVTWRFLPRSVPRRRSSVCSEPSWA